MYTKVKKTGVDRLRDIEGTLQNKSNTYGLGSNLLNPLAGIFGKKKKSGLFGGLFGGKDDEEAEDAGAVGEAPINVTVTNTNTLGGAGAGAVPGQVPGEVPVDEGLDGVEPPAEEPVEANELALGSNLLHDGSVGLNANTFTGNQVPQVGAGAGAGDGGGAKGGGGMMSMLSGGGNPWNMAAGMAGDLLGAVAPGENIADKAQTADANAGNFKFGADYSAGQAEGLEKEGAMMKTLEGLPMIGGFAKLGNSLTKGVVGAFGGRDTQGGAIANAVLNPMSAVKDLFSGKNPFKAIEYSNDDKRGDWTKARADDIVAQEQASTQYVATGSNLNNTVDVQHLSSGLDHENDGNDGIALGTVGTNGLPNKAERGEVVVSLPKVGEFVFSKRLKF